MVVKSIEVWSCFSECWFRFQVLLAVKRTSLDVANSLEVRTEEEKISGETFISTDTKDVTDLYIRPWDCFLFDPGG